MSRELVGFWLKVVEVLPEYYGEGKGSEDFWAEDGWNRIVVLLELCYGKFATQLWKDRRQPTQSDRVCVMARAAWIDDLSAARESAEEGSELQGRMHEALEHALEDEEVKRAVERLQKWRKCTLWTASWDDPMAQRRLGRA